MYFLGAIHQFLFSKYPANHLRLFCQLYCAGISCQLLYDLLNFSKVYPIQNFSSFNLQITLICGGLFFIFLMSAIFSKAKRTSLILSLISGFIYFYLIQKNVTPIFSTSGHHKTNLIIFILFTLSLSPGIGKTSLVSSVKWPICLIQFLLGMTFLSAAISKIRGGAFEWANGENIQSYVYRRFLLTDNSISESIAQYPELLSAFGFIILLFQLSFVIGIFVPRLRPWYLFFVLSFNIISFVILEVNFFRYFVLTYLVFIKPEHLNKLFHPFQSLMSQGHLLFRRG